MAEQTIRVRGLKETVRAFRLIDLELAKEIQREIKEAAQIVRDDAAQAFMHVQPRSAESFRPRVRGARGFVEQRRRKTTGTRGDFGSHQMRYLIAALSAKSSSVEARLEKMLDNLADRNGF